jgi:hypothetical protein
VAAKPGPGSVSRPGAGGGGADADGDDSLTKNSTEAIHDDCICRVHRLAGSHGQII